MDFTIASILTLDGVTNGAIYALMALATVLVFAVTRVIFIPQGEFVAFGALTLAMLQAGQTPGTVWFLLVMTAIAAGSLVAQGLGGSAGGGALRGPRLVQELVRLCAYPLVISAVAVWAAPQKFPLLVQAALTLALVTPLGGLLYRVAYERLADATVLVLLIVSVGVHFALVGLGLFFFGAEGFRNPSFWDERFNVGPLTISGQAVIVILVSLVLIVGLWFLFERTLLGKSLRATAVNRVGARLMGISRTAFTMAAFIGALSGLLIGPTTTVFYDTGFLIGLKGFVAAVFGGLASYPLALVGAVGVGLIEAFGSFWASAFKEVIVFCSILPVLLWRSMTDPHGEEH